MVAGTGYGFQPRDAVVEAPAHTDNVLMKVTKEKSTFFQVSF